MALNPYFLQGSSAEQRLVQDLVNEQLKNFITKIIGYGAINKKTF